MEVEFLSDNSTNSTLPRESLDALEWPGQFVLICLYSTTAGLSLAANVITIIVLLKGERCAKDVRKFLINLSIADITMAIFSIPFTYTLYMFGRWIFPPIMCPIVNTVQLSSLIVSVYTMAAIGVDRYFAIVQPLRATHSWFKSHRTLIICAIWTGGFAIGSTQIFISEIRSFRYEDQWFYDCRETWIQGSNSGKIYTLIVFVVTFILPMIVLSFVYTLMGCTLIRHHLPGNETIHHRFGTRRVKVIKMLSTVVIMFVVCWLPIQVFGLLVWFHPSILVVETNIGYFLFVCLYFFCHWISMAHSFMNPIIYSFMSENFRYDLKLLLRRFCHKLNCNIERCHLNDITTIRIQTNIRKKSSIKNGNIDNDSNDSKYDNKVNRSDDCINTSNTLTITYV